MINAVAQKFGFNPSIVVNNRVRDAQELCDKARISGLLHPELHFSSIS